MFRITRLKNWIDLYIKTIRIEIIILGIVATLIIFIMDMWLNDLPAINNFFYAFGRFVYTLSAAYVASFIFYLITVHIPRENEKTIIYHHALPLFKTILYDGENIFNSLIKSNQKSWTFQELTDDQIRELCLHTNPLSDSPIMEWNGSRKLNWIQFLGYYQRRKDDFLKKILVNLPYLDVEFVGQLTKFADAELFNGLHIMIQLMKEHRLGNTDLGHGMENSFVSYYHLIMSTNRIIEEKYKKYICKSHM